MAGARVPAVRVSWAIRRPWELARALPSVTECEVEFVKGACWFGAGSVCESHVVRCPLELTALARPASGMKVPSLTECEVPCWCGAGTFRASRAVWLPLEHKALPRGSSGVGAPSLSEGEVELAVASTIAVEAFCTSRVLRRPLELTALTRLPTSGTQAPSISGRFVELKSSPSWVSVKTFSGSRAIWRPLEPMDLARLPASGGVSSATGSAIGLGGAACWFGADAVGAVR